ncbi:MAG: 7TM diverse intracellular signaling domain-containing protein [Ramlibacter sp.]
MTIANGGLFPPRVWRALQLALMLVLAAAAILAAAQTEPRLAWGGRGDVPAQYWIDAPGKASLDEARAAFDGANGRAADPSQIMPLGGGVAIWYRLQLPAVAAPAMAVLTVPFGGMDSVELFRPAGQGGWRQQRAGESLPVSQWPLRYLHPAFAFTIQPGETQATYLRVQHSHSTGVSWVLWDASSFAESAKLWHLALGAYAGFMILVVLLSIFNAISWRDPIHLYYAVQVVLVGLGIMSLTGVGGEYLWPDNAWWNDKASVVLPAASLGWMGLFLRELVAERGRRWLSWALLVHAGICVLMVVGFLMLGREQFFRLPSAYGLLALILILALLTWFSVRRPEVGLWVLAGFAALTVGTLFTLFRNLDWMPVSFATQYGPQIGGALEIPLILIGLYFRSRERRDNRVRLEALAHTDPLTGVGNHRVLVERLQVLLGRRSAFSGALLQVHVANLDAIRDEYGREAAEAAIVRAAECVTLEAREGDTVAREQGGDLVLLLEGQLTRGQAAEAGRNIIARGLKFSGRMPPRVTLALRVAGACAPLAESNPLVVLGMLNRLVQDIGNDALGRALRIMDPPLPRRGDTHPDQPRPAP